VFNVLSASVECTRGESSEKKFVPVIIETSLKLVSQIEERSDPLGQVEDIRVLRKLMSAAVHDLYLMFSRAVLRLLLLLSDAKEISQSLLPVISYR